MSATERQAIEEITLPSRSVRASTDLVREGEEADRLYLVVEGWACRYKTTREGSRQIVALLVPGDTANLDSLLFERADYGVRALTAATVLAIPRERVLALAAQHSGIARAVTSLAFGENAILSQWTLSLGRLSAQQRLAHLLCELSVRLGYTDGDEGGFELPLTQEQLADALGLTSVHINRTMQHLRTSGLIATQGRSVTIPDTAKLRRAGEFDPAYLHMGPATAASESAVV